jgi:hypothetical protein
MMNTNTTTVTESQSEPDSTQPNKHGVTTSGLGHPVRYAGLWGGYQVQMNGGHSHLHSQNSGDVRWSFCRLVPRLWATVLQTTGAAPGKLSHSASI